MADPVQRNVPRDQAKGEAQQQQGFLEATRPTTQGPSLTPAAPSPEPVGEALVDEEFGDFSEALFGPSERPLEPIDTPGQAAPSAAFAPSPQNFKLLRDPRVSEDMKGIFQMAMLAHVLNNSRRVE